MPSNEEQIGKKPTIDQQIKNATNSDGKYALNERSSISVPAYLHPQDDVSVPGYGVVRGIAGCINVRLSNPDTVLYGVMTTADTTSSVNELPPNQRFNVVMDKILYDKMVNNSFISNEEIATVQAIPTKSRNNEVHEVSAPDPVSPISKLQSIFSGETTYAEERSQLMKWCDKKPPRTLTQAIAKLKQRNPRTIRLIPPAAQIKQGRYNQNIYEGPVVECNRHGVKIKTDNGAGVKCEGKSTVLSGQVVHASNNEVYPQQVTGIASKPVPLDDFIPKGTVLFPHTKRAPDILGIVQAILPVAQAIKIAVDVAQALRSGD